MVEAAEDGGRVADRMRATGPSWGKGGGGRWAGEGVRAWGLGLEAAAGAWPEERERLKRGNEMGERKGEGRREGQGCLCCRRIVKPGVLQRAQLVYAKYMERTWLFTLTRYFVKRP